MPVKRYQKMVAARLSELFTGVSVQCEWAAMSDEANLYSPRLDIAVGPFATHARYIEQYDELMDKHPGLIERMMICHCENIAIYNGGEFDVSFERLKYKNQNARCFLAIEIENRVSRKHLMGGAINAAALGRIGIAVAFRDDKLKAFVKLRSYLNFLASVGKNTFDTTNLLILSADQLLACIELEG